MVCAYSVVVVEMRQSYRMHQARTTPGGRPRHSQAGGSELGFWNPGRAQGPGKVGSRTA